jgi:plastocyanin domain-containing protein
MSCAECERQPRSSLRKWVVLGAMAGGVGLIMVVAPAKGGPSTARTPSTLASGIVTVQVNDQGFFPSSISIGAGQAAELEFTRTTEETCAASVVFPELGITRELPLNRPVRVPVPADQTRTLAFQCGVGDHRSAVVIH